MAEEEARRRCGARRNAIVRMAADGASERVIVARKPGNSGGAKDPYFRHATKETKERVIDDESGNAR